MPHTGGGAAERTVGAGEQVSFTRFSASQPQALVSATLAWTGGMLLADEMRLADFVRELERYRRGVLRLDPALENLRVSGAFPVADTEQVLRMLATTYPLQVDTFIPGYWVSLSSRQEP
jgi:transmembrane sensor